MTTYTGVADANGDFMIPFSSNYTSGEKITVTAEKEGALKTIKLFAPSDVSGGGFFQYSGNLNDFPNNIGIVTISELQGVINNYAFAGQGNESNLFKKATGLIIAGSATHLGEGAFMAWKEITSLDIQSQVVEIGELCFMSANALKKVTIPATIQNIKNSAFYDCGSLAEVIVKNPVPPTCGVDVFVSAPSTFRIKVPNGSVNAYKAKPGWSAYASKIIAY